MIDWARVDELQGEVGAEDFAEIAGLFLSEIEEAVGGLAGTAPADLPDALHGLKGAAMNLGFDGIAALCAAGERAPDAAPLAEIAAGWAAASAAFRARFPAFA